MAFGQRQLVLLLFLFLVVASSAAVPTSRSVKLVKDQLPVRNFHSQVVKETYNDDEPLKMERLVEGRMNIELADYPGPGANHDHDPGTPGRV